VRIHELITRIKSFIITPDFDAMCQAIESVRSWERPVVSIGAWVGWLLFVNFFRLWMIPFGLAIGVLVGSKKEDEEEKKKEEKKEKKHSKMKDLKFIANSKEGFPTFLNKTLFKVFFKPLDRHRKTWNGSRNYWNEQSTLSNGLFHFLPLF